MTIKLVLSSFLASALALSVATAQGVPPGKGQEAPPPVKQAPKKQAGKKEAGKKEAGKKDKADPGKTGKTEAAKKDDKKGVIKTREADESDIELPPNATEDDIRAIRGAKAMLETEKRLAEVLKKMKVGGGVDFVRFDDIDAWPYEDGYKGMPKHLKKLDGKKVAMAGFMLPIDEVENIKQFYLVKSLWSCCFGIPPDVNGLVKINVKGKKGCAYQYDPILIVGTFRLKKVMDEDYCVCIFQIDDARVQVIEFD